MPPPVREIGVPVHAVNWVHLHPGRRADGVPCLVAAMGQESAPLFVLRIDPDTGACIQRDAAVPKANFPTATCLSRDGRLYIGAAYAGHLLRFDPTQDLLEDLGPIHPEAATFPCRIDEDADGRLWIGSYGSADLTAYDPSDGRFTRYGPMAKDDMYNYPLVAPDGTIACLVRVTRPHVVRFDPRSGKHAPIGPQAVQGEDTLDLLRGEDGRLYIASSLGNFRLDGDEAVAVEALPAPMPKPRLADGRAFEFADAAEQTHRQLRVSGPGQESQSFTLDYRASGSRIFYLHAGPDRCLYGSSILPLHLFRYQPNDGELIDLGRCSTATGEAYSMANFAGRLFVSSYPQAKLSVYDPSQGYRFGEDAGANPRDVGRIDEISYRPRSTLAGPLGRVWTASLPDYGRWGGPLSWYDPQSGEKGAYYRICGDASCYTLAWLESSGLIAVGTSIHGGTGTNPKVERAELFLWDYAGETKTWSGGPDWPATVFNALLPGPDGLLYGSTLGPDRSDARLFAFEADARRFIDLGPPPGMPLDLGLQADPNGRLYGFTETCLYRLYPAGEDGPLYSQVLRPEVPIQVAGPILGDTVYFSSNHRLFAARIT